MCDVYPGNGGDGGRSWVQIRPICSVISQLLVTCSSPYPLYLVLDAKKGSPTASSDSYENPLWKCLQSFQRDQFQTWRESKRTWIKARGNWSGEINSAKASTGIKIRQCRPRSKGNRPGENVSELISGKFARKIMNFSVILKNAKSGSGKEIYSSPFVTGKQGYKFSICLRPDGDHSKISHINLF